MTSETRAPARDAGVSRREFLVRSSASAAGAVLAIGFGAAGPRPADAAATPAFTPSIWFTMLPSGQTIVHVVKAEMGQHIGTALAQIVADELEIDWNKVTLDYPEGSAENFAAYGLAYTVNSGSVTTEFDRLSRAGAAGRIVLIEAGAALLGARRRQLPRPPGPRHRQRFRALRFLRRHPRPDQDRPDLRLPGTTSAACRARRPRSGGSSASPPPALDVPEKTNGQAQYGIDTFVPGMVYAALAIPPRPLQVQGGRRRRLRSAEGSRFHPRRDRRRQLGQMHRLGAGARRPLPGRGRRPRAP